MEKALTLYELNNLVRGTLETVLSDEYWLQAELSEVRVAYNGHCYMEFVEKDADGRQLVAKARGMIWSNVFRSLNPFFERETGRRLAAGLKVLVRVKVSFHELYGYSLTVTGIDPTYTIGDIERRRREILQQLADEGILNDNKSLPLPVMMNRIAVISSATAAGYGDFCDQLYHNDYKLRFVTRLFPAVMQGENVEASVLSALNAVLSERDCWDAVVIIRGGGAVSDLAGFDTYLLAAGCAQFPLPVITGIGHERDDTVLDLVAHTRVKTPTAAAAFLVSHQLDAATHVEDLGLRMVNGARLHMQGEMERIRQAAMRLPTVFTFIKTSGEHRLSLLSGRLRHAADRVLAGRRYKLAMAGDRFFSRVPAMLDRERFRLKLLEQRCEAVDPRKLLKRGYSMTFCNGHLVRDAARLKPGDEIMTYVAEGSVCSVVKDTKHEKENNDL